MQPTQATIVREDDSITCVALHGNLNVDGVDSGAFELHVVDDGRRFELLSAPQADLDAPIEERRVGGLGLRLLRRPASRTRCRRIEGRNHLGLWIQVPAPGRPPPA